MHNVGREICRETLKNLKNASAHSMTLKMAIKLENERNQKHTEQDMEYVEKH